MVHKINNLRLPLWSEDVFYIFVVHIVFWIGQVRRTKYEQLGLLGQ